MGESTTAPATKASSASLAPPEDSSGFRTLSPQALRELDAQHRGAAPSMAGVPIIGGRRLSDASVMSAVSYVSDEFRPRAI